MSNKSLLVFLNRLPTYLKKGVRVGFGLSEGGSLLWCGWCPTKTGAISVPRAVLTAADPLWICQSTIFKVLSLSLVPPRQ